MITQVKLLRNVEDQLDDIVQLAEECIAKTNATQKEITGSQLRNLQNLAAATNSLRALENFIAYQMGRGNIPKEVGNQIMEDFQYLYKKAKEIANNEKADEQFERKLLIEMIQMYLGFLVRKFVAERKGEEK
ncbi:hypothetical protein [Acetomicrobium hydrogeniformans]|jgi:hypothetical protein|uniref:CRISPR type III A-associated protein Csm2 n=1 Tax=Acetomicrobium hydrogeniformans ATCC BAA-1850 TaxID=592015 RepID=A0A0T5X8L4_9BACT|nr:hypothetical protein [Acetomicrobium hydrogeniformans]KRT34764.1 hypothetical protein HMPREF1705_04010 [Acetomicrobium hydrogeniformans ATCC BAA-1850]